MSDTIPDMGRHGPARYGWFGFSGKNGIISLPADLVKDTTFPFTNGDNLLIRVDGERLIVEKSKKRRE